VQSGEQIPTARRTAACYVANVFACSFVCTDEDHCNSLTDESQSPLVTHVASRSVNIVCLLEVCLSGHLSIRYGLLT